MKIDPEVLTREEQAIFRLRSLYRSRGYQPYKMSKFEEYDLYVKNKDFLISDNILTFTDTNGKLMALKPDVTLSIIKNSKDLPDDVRKLYYNETVYRTAKGTHRFREIMQTGLECIGKIDDGCIGEVLLLAAGSLACISPSFVLDISHLDLLTDLVDGLSPRTEIRKALMHCVGEKNLHEISDICRDNDLDPARTEILKQLASLYGTPETVLPRLQTLLKDCGAASALAQLERAVKVFETSPYKDCIRIDFSVISDIKYYNGIVFKGFLNHIPDSVLSGGQYDRLMQKMHRRSGAIGFAVYLDELQRFDLKEEGLCEA